MRTLPVNVFSGPFADGCVPLRLSCMVLPSPLVTMSNRSQIARRRHYRPCLARVRIGARTRGRSGHQPPVQWPAAGYVADRRDVCPSARARIQNRSSQRVVHRRRRSARPPGAKVQSTSGDDHSARRARRAVHADGAAAVLTSLADTPSSMAPHPAGSSL